MKSMLDSDIRVLNKRHKYISFTFDDAPTSALLSASDILHKRSIKGTYYIAMGLLEKGCFSKADIITCAQQLHHIECHTFNHVNLVKDFDEELLDSEVKKNLAAVQEILPDFQSLDNFAYPFGAVDKNVKKNIKKYFSSARGIASGINQERIDLYELSAVQLYEDKTPLSVVEKYINSLRAEGGWLIFYTHDVQDAFSNYGCSVEYFKQVVELCNHLDISCLPVADVLKDIYENK